MAALPRELINEFVKMTKDDTPAKKETNTFGTVVRNGNTTYVKLDGADVLTPVVTTTNVEDGERVTVMIKNHTAVVTGNITSPSARTAEVESVSGDVSQVKADIANVKILMADKVSTEKLEAQIGRIEDLESNNVKINERLTAAEADIEKLDVENLEAISADIKYLKSDEAFVDHLNAITAKINEVVAGKITTDEFYAALADITVLAAGTATFDKATVKHLVAQAMNLEYGVGEQVFVKNLAVEFAQMVSATIGDLCIKASDGNYYLLDVGADGSVTATKTTVSSSEINAGETNAGKVILGTDITAANLNTSNLLATYALVNKIDAARIDVDQLTAREGFITSLFAQEIFTELLRTSKIVGDKTLTLIVGDVEDAKSAASSAQSTANSASQTASNAQSTANSASQTASNAQSTANDAKTTANSASQAASNAQSTANTAKNTADSAKSTADSASKTASNAQSTANAAQTTANDAQVSVNNLDRLSNIEVIEGTFAQTERREGEGIRIYSEIGPKQDLKWGAPWSGGAGKNLCPFMVKGATYSAGGMTAEVTDEGMIVNGTPSAAYATLVSKTIELPAGTYTVSGGNTVYGVILQINVIRADGSIGYYSNKTFTIDGTEQRIVAVVQNGTEIPAMTNYVLKAQLEAGSTATSYAPYANTPPIEGWTGLNATRRGRNLLPPGLPIETTMNGITFTSDGKGTYKMNGTATRTAYLKVNLAAPVTFGDMVPYIHLFNSAASSKCSFAYFRPDGSQITWTTTNPANRIQYQASLINETISAINLYVDANETVNNLVMTPMMCFDGDTVPFEPYQGADYMLDFGKNLWNNSAIALGPHGITITETGFSFVRSVSGASYAYYKRPVRSGETLTFSAKFDNYFVDMYIYADKIYGTQLAVNKGAGKITYTATADYPDAIFAFAINSANGDCTVSEIQLELGSVATEYVPYNAELLDKTGGMVYGGTVDWNAGEMTVEGWFDEYDGTEDWKMDGNLFYLPLDSLVKTSNYTNVITCSHFIADSNQVFIDPSVGGISGYHDYNNSYYPGKNWIYLRFSDADTVEKHKAYIAAQKAAGTPVQVYYKLAEPYTIQLTPVQIASLKGINTVYTDADDGRVEFGHDIVEVIDSVMPPASPKTGALWLDRSLTPAVLRRWSGSEWEIVNDMSLIESTQDALMNKQAELEAEQRRTALYLKLDDSMKAVRIGQTGITSEFRIDAFGSGVVVNDEIFSRFEANRVLFGNMEIRRPNVGGLAFDSIE